MLNYIAHNAVCQYQNGLLPVSKIVQSVKMFLMAKAKCDTSGERSRTIRIGTSGWHYGHWAGPFYPPDLPKDKWLEYYAQHFDTVELNNTFYHLPKEQSLKRWRTIAPKNFVYAVKASRYITHIKRLKDVSEELTRFLDLAALLGRKLGPILYQLPPSLHKDLARLESFLQVLSNVILNPSLCSRTGSAKRPVLRSSSSATAEDGSEESLSRRPDSVFEFRHESWYCEDTYKLLRKFNVGFCIHTVARPSWPCLHGLEARATPRVVTGDIIYVRFHGTTGRYSGCYSKTQLRNWAKWLKEQSRNVRSIYVYFNNDACAYAVRNAKEMKELC
jgi:uncharacterized protein YecE (DUF72 family)